MPKDWIKYAIIFGIIFILIKGFSVTDFLGNIF